MKKKYRNKLPKGAEVKGYIAHVDNGETDVEVELKDRFQPKDGDFLVSANGNVFIYSDKPSVDEHTYSCHCGEFLGRWKINTKFSDNWSEKEGCRFATTKEKLKFLERLKKECRKRWNAEKKCLEDIRWKPKDGELFWFVGMNFNVYSTHYVSSFSVDSLRVKTLNCFRTEQAAQKAANQIIEIFKNSKAE